MNRRVLHNNNMYLFQCTEVVTKMDCMQVGDINVADEARDFV